MGHLPIDYRISKQLLSNKGGSYARPIVRLSVTGIALAIVIMILSLAVTEGYRAILSKKIVDMGAHVRISNLAINYSYEPVPFDRDLPFVDTLLKHKDVKSLHFYFTKVGIIKTDDQVEGVVLKGVEPNFYSDGFETNIIEGSAPTQDTSKQNSQIVVSSYHADKLNLKIGDKVRLYFVQNPPKYRSFTICGIYATGLPEYDEAFAIVDLRQVQKLYENGEGKVGGIEVMLHDFDKTPQFAKFANAVVGADMKAEPIQQIYPQIFEWMDMFSANVWVLLTITFIVCLVTVISTFFIIILEQIPTIGILKTMGMKNKRIISIFLLVATKVVVKGLVIGNIIALSACLIQKHFHIVKLSEEAYYVDSVPVMVQWGDIIGINLAVVALCLLAVLVPAYFVARKVTPVRAVRYE
ncbi:MAG: ABC transporter permease [Bacteroidales bacterium]|nr:ABC transporter permease [Bacteroidales bacterium]